jgi:hypothetical protein
MRRAALVETCVSSLGRMVAFRSQYVTFASPISWQRHLVLRPHDANGVPCAFDREDAPMTAARYCVAWHLRQEFMATLRSETGTPYREQLALEDHRRVSKR